MRYRILIFICSLMFSSCLLSNTIDITNSEVPQWNLELDDEVLLKDVFAPPFDYQYFNNNLYMVLHKGPAIVVYDLNGDIVSINDHKGEGPGELNQPVYIWNSPDHEGITIFDEGHFRYHHFDHNLKYIESTEMTPQQFINKIYTFDNQQYRHFTVIDFVDGSVEFKHSLQYLKDEDSIDIYSTKCHMFLKGWFRYNQPVSRIMAKDKLITAIQSRSEYKVMIIDNGEIETTITKKMKPVRFSNEEIDEARIFTSEMEERFRNMYKTPEEIITNQMVISDLAIAPNNNIWILTRDEEGQYFDILSETGELIATARTDDSSKLARPYVLDNYLYIAVDEEEEDFYLKRYKIIK